MKKPNSNVNGSGNYNLKIRKLGSSDLEGLVGVASSWLANTDCALPINAAASSEWLCEALKNKSYGIFGLYNEKVGIVGWIIGTVADYPVLHRKCVVEHAWYIDPSFRGHGRELLTALIQWGKEQGAEFLISCILLSAGTDRGRQAFRSLEKMGFKEFERTYYLKI